MSAPTEGCDCTSHCGDDPRIKASKVRPCGAYVSLAAATAEQRLIADLLPSTGHATVSAALQALIALQAQRATEEQVQAGLNQLPDQLFVETKPGELGDEISVGVDRRGGSKP